MSKLTNMKTCDHAHGEPPCKDSECYLMPPLPPMPGGPPTHGPCPPEVKRPVQEVPTLEEIKQRLKLEETAKQEIELQVVDVTWPQDVVDFHEKFKINYGGGPRMLPPNLKYFRHQRNEEECKEFYFAPNKAEALDAIVDQIYILLGTAHLCGFTPEILAKAWQRVHAANMKKEVSTPENPGKYGAVGSDIVKPKGWVAPDLTDLVEGKDV